MEDFILILHDPIDSPLWKASPEELQSVIERYKKWGADMAATGNMRGGSKLEDGTCRNLSGKAGSTAVTDGPFPETKEIIGGYYLIAAKDYDEAVALSSASPHLDYGRIEIRKLESV